VTNDTQDARNADDITQALQPDGPFDRMLKELLREFSDIKIDVRALNAMLAAHEARLTELAAQMDHLQVLVGRIR
jgi:histone H3/H4